MSINTNKDQIIFPPHSRPRALAALSPSQAREVILLSVLGGAVATDRHRDRRRQQRSTTSPTLPGDFRLTAHLRRPRVCSATARARAAAQPVVVSRPSSPATSHVVLTTSVLSARDFSRRTHLLINPYTPRATAHVHCHTSQPSSDHSHTLRSLHRCTPHHSPSTAPQRAHLIYSPALLRSRCDSAAAWHAGPLLSSIALHPALPLPSLYSWMFHYLTPPRYAAMPTHPSIPPSNLPLPSPHLHPTAAHASTPSPPSSPVPLLQGVPNCD